MGTTLFAITNSQLSGNETEQDWQKLLEKLQALALQHLDNASAEDEVIWEYLLPPADGIADWLVSYDGPNDFSIDVYPQAAVISTIHRYWVLQETENVSSQWFIGFRQNLFKIVQALGGTEVIFLPDNDKQPLCNYLHMTEDGHSYKEVKQQLTNELGLPYTSYAEFSNSNVCTERFILDDFADLVGV